MKSAGAAKKGGTSPVTAVLDYPEYSTEPGLHLQCTPGNDVECVTAQVGAGASVVLFTTGLGTPTGNPIAPVVKLSTNSSLARRMGGYQLMISADVFRGRYRESLETAKPIAAGKPLLYRFELPTANHGVLPGASPFGGFFCFLCKYASKGLKRKEKAIALWPGAVVL